MKAPNSFVEAILNGHFESAKTILSSGIDINAAYDNGWTALHYAIEDVALESALWLMENGADINRPNSSGWAPIHLAVDVETDLARQQWTLTGVSPPAAKLLKLLLAHGADVNAKTTKGETALELARAGGNSEAVEILEGYGASAVD